MGKTVGYQAAGKVFEYDEEKSALNVATGFLPFTEAYRCWLMPFGDLLDGNTDNEERLLRRGIIEGRMWTCVYTMRGTDGETFRIISLKPTHEKLRR